MDEKSVRNQLLFILHEISKMGIHKDKQSKFNIFSTLKIENNEVLICRFLGYLLNPRENHNFNDLFIRSFFETCLNIQEELNYNDAVIILEEHTDNNRRVDIAIYIDNNVYPIEVKVWAGDQPHQLCDYYQYYDKDKKASINKIYYLTPTLKEPSKDSRGKLVDEISLISFKNEIQNWLNECQNHINNDELKTVVNQFIGVINNMCEYYDGFENIKNIVFESGTEDTQIAALSLIRYKEEILNEFRTEYIKNHFEKFETDFKFEEMSKEEKEDYKNGILKVVFNNKNLLFICFDTYLYIFIAKEFKQCIDNRFYKWREINSEYPWVYLTFDDKKVINLKSPLENKEDIFDINKKFNLKNYVDFSKIKEES